MAGKHDTIIRWMFTLGPQNCPEFAIRPFGIRSFKILVKYPAGHVWPGARNLWGICILLVGRVIKLSNKIPLYLSNDIVGRTCKI